MSSGPVVSSISEVSAELQQVLKSIGETREFLVRAGEVVRRTIAMLELASAGSAGRQLDEAVILLRWTGEHIRSALMSLKVGGEYVSSYIEVIGSRPGRAGKIIDAVHGLAESSSDFIIMIDKEGAQVRRPCDDELSIRPAPDELMQPGVADLFQTQTPLLHSDATPASTQDVFATAILGAAIVGYVTFTGVVRCLKRRSHAD
jgi:hypothetical protein